MPARPGRPRKADKYGGHIAAAEDLIADKLPWIVAKGLELIEGVWVEEPGPKGTRRVYKRPPCSRTMLAFLERIAGKAVQAVELNNGDDGPLKIQVVYADALDPADAPEAAPGAGEDPPGDPPV